MANTINWGQAAVENTIDYGQGATDNTISWGKSQTLSPGGETNITGAGGTPAFSNTLSTTFDGNDDYVDCSSASNSISADNEGTVSLWVKPNDISSNQTIVNLSASTLTRQYLVLNLSSSLGFTVDMRTTSNSSSGFIVHANVNPFSVGAWTHLAVVQNGVSPQLYVNGVAVAQTFLVSTNDQKWLNDMGSFDSINIGRIFTSDLDQNYYDGLVDEVSYFSSALSSSDMLSIYNSGVPTDLTQFSTTPIFYYRMGEGSTYPTINDEIGSNNGLMKNMSAANFVTDVPT